MTHAFAIDLLGRLVLGLGLLYYAWPRRWERWGRWSYPHEAVRWLLLVAIVFLAVEAIDEH